MKGNIQAALSRFLQKAPEESRYTLYSFQDRLDTFTSYQNDFVSYPFFSWETGSEGFNVWPPITQQVAMEQDFHPKRELLFK